MRINTPKKRKIFTFVMRCISFLSLFSFHSLIVRFPLPGCFYSKRTSVCRLPFLLGWAMATDSSGATCFRFPMNLLPSESSAYIFFFRLLFFLHPPLCIQLLPSTFLFFRIIRCLKPSQLPSSTLFKLASAIRRHSSYTLPLIRGSALPAGSAFFLCHCEAAPSSWTPSLSIPRQRPSPTDLGAFLHFCLSYVGLNTGSNRFSLRFFRPPGREAPNFGRKSG